MSNNRYRLGRVVGSGTRPMIDDGRLGITVAGLPRRPLQEWTTRTFEVGAEHPLHAGIDGEAATLDPPLRFTIRRRVLRVRIAPAHPGASPSALLPDSFSGTARTLLRIASGRDPAVRQSTTKET